MEIIYKDGDYKIQKGQQIIKFEPSISFGGSGIFINPSEILASSVASCIMINFVTYLEDNGIVADNIISTYSIEKTDAEMKIIISINVLDTKIDESILIENIRFAEKDCIISKYFKGIVYVSLQKNYKELEIQ